MHDDLDTLTPALRTLGLDLGRAMREAEKGNERPSRAPHRRGFLLLGVTLAAAAVAVLAIGLTDQGGSLSSQVPAADAFERAARAASKAPSLMPADGQYFYVRSQGTQLMGGGGGVIALETTSDRRWISADRPNISISIITAISYPSARDRRALGSAPRPPLPSPLQLPPRGGYDLGEHLLTRGQLLNYPTDPRAIYKKLYGDSRGGSREAASQHVFSEISESLSGDPIPPALRGGLYRALALVPNVRLEPNLRDSTGRIGVGASIVRAGVREQIIFDPASAELLEERSMVLSPSLAGLDARRGKVIKNITYLDWAVTDTAPHGRPLTGAGTITYCPSGESTSCRRVRVRGGQIRRPPH